MLDEIHDDTLKPSHDPNTYSLGSVGQHNVVIACGPHSNQSRPDIAAIVVWMTSMFPAIRLCMLIGLGSGIPPKVKLGDVVVGVPYSWFPGVVQWERGENGGFRKTEEMEPPPSTLISALTKLQSIHELYGSSIPEYLAKIQQNKRLASKYLVSDSLQDHESTKSGPRETEVHYGLIANTTLRIRDKSTREEFNLSLGGERLLCIDMEGSILMPKLPCIVIRGICNYADGHRDGYEGWEEPAAAACAAFAKEVLSVLPEAEVAGRLTIKSLGTSVF
ncbi:Pfs domain protein [Rostrohypoxylon terebratum]|nr:Pfs domain protein [Rostrohypoxylon terebratum]